MSERTAFEAGLEVAGRIPDGPPGARRRAIERAFVSYLAKRGQQLAGLLPEGLTGCESCEAFCELREMVSGMVEVLRDVCDDIDVVAETWPDETDPDVAAINATLAESQRKARAVLAPVLARRPSAGGGR